MKTLKAVIGACLMAAALTAAVVALWPASEADKARDDGEQLGTAVAHLQQAESQSDVDDALAEVDEAVRESSDHAGDYVADQVAAQDDALDRAVEGYVGAVQSTDEWEQEVYETELDWALSDLEYNAEEFRSEAPEVQEAYWEGFEDGYDEE